MMSGQQASVRPGPVERLSVERGSYPYPPLKHENLHFPIWSPETMNWNNWTLFPVKSTDERICINFRIDHGVLTYMRRTGKTWRKTTKIYLSLRDKKQPIPSKGTLRKLLWNLGFKPARNLSVRNDSIMFERREFALYRTFANSPLTDIMFVPKSGIEVVDSDSLMLNFYSKIKVPISKHERKRLLSR
jgi:hypothetical protein